MTTSRPTLLVTGGTRGIGAAIARRAATLGYTVCVTYRNDDDAAAELLRQLKAGNTPCMAIKGDVAEPDFAERAFAEAEASLGPITALVNNAGITGRIGAFVDTTPETLQAILAVNLLGAMLMCQAALRRWQPAGIRGSIVNISSIASTLGAPHEYVGYAASKAGVEALTVGLAKEVASTGIRVNAVAPGTVYTDIHATAGEPGRPQRVVSRVPMARIGEPDEIANAVTWLLSEEASYTTGAVLRVSGGL